MDTYIQVIVAWNGLVISAMARASKILKVEPENAKFYFPVIGCEVRKWSSVQPVNFPYLTEEMKPVSCLGVL